jgi:hypothetical protein
MAYRYVSFDGFIYRAWNMNAYNSINDPVLSFLPFLSWHALFVRLRLVPQLEALNPVLDWCKSRYMSPLGQMSLLHQCQRGSFLPTSFPALHSREPLHVKAM